MPFNITNTFHNLGKMVTQVKAICKEAVNAAIPIALGLVASDIIIGTKFGVLNRAVAMVNKVASMQNAIGIVIVVCLVMYLGRKQP